MFERFTDRARQVVMLAQHEARTLGHGYVGTEHLLLGLLGTSDGVAAQVLASAGVSAPGVRRSVSHIVGQGPPPAPDPTGPADADALRAIGIDIDSVRARIEASFGPGALELASRPRRRRGPALQRRGRSGRGGRPCSGSPRLGGHVPFTPRSKKVLELSLREAISLRHNYIGTEHVLLGLLREGEGLAAEVLVQQGLSIADLRQRVLNAIGKVT